MGLLPRYVLVSVLLLSGLAADSSGSEPSSSEPTPVGRWKTVDDATGKVKSVVVIGEEHGKVYGTIEKVLDRSSAGPDLRCSHCPGELKNAPLLGLRILWD